MRAMAATAAAVLIGLLLAAALSGAISRSLNASAVHTLETRAGPAQIGVIELGDVYRRAHTAQVAFEFTGMPRFAAVADAGWRRATQLEAHLGGLLSDDPAALSALAATQSAADRWHTAATAAAGARPGGARSHDQITAAVRADRLFYTATTRRLQTLLTRVNEIARAELAGVAARQSTSNVIAWSALVAAVVVSVAAVPVLRRKVTRPLHSLLRQIAAASIGDAEQPISVPGAPAELAGIAAASEKMRLNLLQGARRLADAQGKLAVHDERDRFAGDLHDHAVQDVFALSLALSAAAARYPRFAEVFEPLIDQTDRVIRQFRAIIFDVKEPVRVGPLSTQLRSVAATSSRALGFPPDLELGPAVDSDIPPPVAANLVAVARESLSNVARHAQATRVEVELTREGDTLQLRVSDDGIGIDAGRTPVGQGLDNLRARAQRLGGTVKIDSAPAGGTTVVWRVPLRGLDGHPAPLDEAAAASATDAAH